MIIKCIFASICALQWAKVERCFEIVFFNFTIFGFLNAKKNVWKKIRVAGAVGYKLV